MAPPIPSSVVIINPKASLPGIRARAKRPTTNPMIIDQINPIAESFVFFELAERIITRKRFNHFIYKAL